MLSWNMILAKYARLPTKGKPNSTNCADFHEEKSIDKGLERGFKKACRQSALVIDWIFMFKR